VKKVLITGAAGMLAPYLIHSAQKSNVVVTTARKNGDVACNLSDEKSVKKMLKEVDPDWVIHAAALSSVELCEENPELADQSNRVNTENIARNLKKHTRLVFISTDQVYPDLPGPHIEQDVGPVNMYGRTKLSGEQAALKHHETLVIRTNMFGKSLTKGRTSIDDFVVNSLKNGDKITLFSDISFSPLHMRTISNIIMEMLQKEILGVFNIGCRDGMSKSDFGLAIAKKRGLSVETVKIGESDSIKGRVQRLHDMRLDVSRLENVLHLKMPTLLEEISKL